MGASGSGKTTLMNILGCLDHPTSGKYWFDGQEMSGLGPNQRALVRSEKIGFVFQNFNLLPRTSALHNVTMPLDYALHRRPAAESQELACSLLDRVGLTDRIDHEPSQMSGGQQQRVAIARALINRPGCFWPTSRPATSIRTPAWKSCGCSSNSTPRESRCVLVTHDPNVATYAHRTIRLTDGLVDGDEINTSVLDAGVGRPPAPHIRAGGNGNGDGAASLVSAGVQSAAVGWASRETASGSHTRHDTADVVLLADESSGGVLVAEAPANEVPAASTVAKPHVHAAPELLPATWRTALGACGETRCARRFRPWGLSLPLPR